MFPKAFRDARDKAGWRQVDLETALGLHAQHLSQIESGRKPPLDPERIRIACNLLKIPDQARYFQLLAEWETFLRHMPHGARFGRATLECIGKLYATEKLDPESWAMLRDAIEGIELEQRKELNDTQPWPRKFRPA